MVVRATASGWLRIGPEVADGLACLTVISGGYRYARDRMRIPGSQQAFRTFGGLRLAYGRASRVN